MNIVCYIWWLLPPKEIIVSKKLSNFKMWFEIQSFICLYVTYAMQKFLSREDYMLLGILKKQSEDNLGFPHSSVGKEPACNAGDPHSIPGSGKSPGDGIGYQLQYSRFSLVTSRLRIHLQCWRPGFDPWTWEDPLEKGKATQAGILQNTGVLEYSGLENSRDYTAHGVARVRQDWERLSLSLSKNWSGNYTFQILI